MFDDAQLVKYFPAMLKALRARIEALPDSLPVALPDGPLARYFGDFEIDEEEGAQFTANRHKHTMSDSRSSMAASTAAATVVTKELLNAGFGEGVDFLEGVSIH
ncbi:hypothetical protein R3P38DRAFT_2809095 [Favolaschia claudopus]|uniref:Uncharacterized protein n=1 Tax=Favolaschia claudopus TaxID=2862362 RepID=A0AAV9ZE57_9AGAR